MLGRVEYLKISTRVEWSIWLNFGVEWSGVLKISSTTRVFGQYSGVVAGVVAVVKKIDKQKIFRNTKKSVFFSKYSEVPKYFQSTKVFSGTVKIMKKTYFSLLQMRTCNLSPCFHYSRYLAWSTGIVEWSGVE